LLFCFLFFFPSLSVWLGCRVVPSVWRTEPRTDPPLADDSVQHGYGRFSFGEHPVGNPPRSIVPKQTLFCPDNCLLLSLVHAPTMRVPGSIEGDGQGFTRRPWPAVAWPSRNTIRQPATGDPQDRDSWPFPSLVTGFGGVPFIEAARQDGSGVPAPFFLDAPHRLERDFVAERQRPSLSNGGRQVVR